MNSLDEKFKSVFTWLVSVWAGFMVFYFILELGLFIFKIPMLKGINQKYGWIGWIVIGVAGALGISIWYITKKYCNKLLNATFSFINTLTYNWSISAQFLIGFILFITAFYIGSGNFHGFNINFLKSFGAFMTGLIPLLTGICSLLGINVSGSDARLSIMLLGCKWNKNGEYYYSPVSENHNIEVIAKNISNKNDDFFFIGIVLASSFEKIKNELNDYVILQNLYFYRIYMILRFLIRMPNKSKLVN